LEGRTRAKLFKSRRLWLSIEGDKAALETWDVAQAELE
jgi:hypothetical protein